MSNCTDVIVHYRFYKFFFLFFFCTDVIVQHMVLRCDRTLLAMMLLCHIYVALMLLFIASRTFSIGTDVFVPVCGCTDVIVQHLCFGS